MCQDESKLNCQGTWTWDWDWEMGNKVSGIELFLVKSIPRWKGDVIMIENDIEHKKGVTNTLKLMAHYYLLKTN